MKLSTLNFQLSTIRLAILTALIALASFAPAAPEGTAKEIPEPLASLEGWATWDDADYRLSFALSGSDETPLFLALPLALEIESTSGRFNLERQCFQRDMDSVARRQRCLAG